MHIKKKFNHFGEVVKKQRAKVNNRGAQIRPTTNNKRPMAQSKLSFELGYKNGQFISNVERGLCGLPAEKLPLLCEVLKTPIDVFLQALLEDELEYLKACYDEHKFVA